MECDGKPLTLREIMMTLRYPFNPKEGEQTYQLFDAVDFSPNPREPGTVLVVAVNNRLDIARSTLSVLSEYVSQFYGLEFAKKWFTPMAVANGQDNEVKFVRDEDGNWTGVFSTKADQTQKKVLNEVKNMWGIQIDGLEIMEDPVSRTILSADEATVHSFGSAFAGGAGVSMASINSKDSSKSDDSSKASDKPLGDPPYPTEQSSDPTDPPAQATAEAMNVDAADTPANQVPPAPEDLMEVSLTANGLNGGEMNE
jgi:hypothetical protein